jgi:uncharacterized membrane protein YcaP (DUF421 family)
MPDAACSGKGGGALPHMFHFQVPPLAIAVRSLAMYVALLLALRASGKREVGQFTLFDLVLVLLVANAIQPAMTGPDTSLGGGFVIIAVLFGANFLVARLRARSPLVEELTEAHPTIIARDGHWLRKALRREGISRDELGMILREHDLQSVREVTLAVLEPDGTISVLKRGIDLIKGRRKVGRTIAVPSRAV